MRSLRLAALLLLLCFLPGCWSRIEVNDLGLALAMAVDAGQEKRVRMTLFYARQGQSGAQAQPVAGDPVSVITREADTVSDALEEITLAVGRRTSLHHVRTVLVGEEYARQGIAELLDFLIRHFQIRITLRPIIVWGRAEEVLSTPPELRGLQPQNVVAILEARLAVDNMLQDFLIARVSETHSGWMHGVKVIARPARTPYAPSTAVIVYGAGVFKGDRLVETLDPLESQVIQWMVGDPKGMVITSPCPDGNGSMAAAVKQGKTRIEPRLGPDGLRIAIRLRGQVKMTQLGCRTPLTTAEGRRQVTAQLERVIVERFERVIAKLQAAEADPGGVGVWVRLRYPAYFRSLDDWSKVWKGAPVTISAEMNLAESGELMRPATLTDRELRYWEQ